MANHPILLDEGGQLLAWPKGEWAEPHPKLAPYYRRIGQLVRFGTLEISITFTPFFQPNQGHTTIHNMPPRDIMGSHTSLNPYSKKVDSLFWLKNQTKKTFASLFCCWAPNLSQKHIFQKFTSQKYMIKKLQINITTSMVQNIYQKITHLVM